LIRSKLFKKARKIFAPGPSGWIFHKFHNLLGTPPIVALFKRSI
jgi:hypothetical protein